MTTAAVTATDLVKDYVLKSETVHALRGISFEIPQGDYVAVMGPSGSGKSTLLNLLGCLDRPTAGALLLGDSDVSELTDNELSDIRAQRVGFVFQSYNLIQQLNVVENIQVPLYYQGNIGRQQKQHCRDLADMVGLGDRIKHRPSQLSGGQQQRVAIARSMANDPYFILADEPTGNLDSVTSSEILDLFDKLHQEGRTIILVTHEDDVAARTNRTIRLMDGEIEFDKRTKPITSDPMAAPTGAKEFDVEDDIIIGASDVQQQAE